MIDLRQAKATPIIKWVGGKTKLLDELVARAPARFGHYFEPFAGGAALFFRLAPPRATIADSSAHLITLYTVVRDDVEELIRKLRRHRAAHDETYYYAMRDRWNSGRFKTRVAQAAAFLYFNRTCFNGLWRVNRAGAFNVPMGRYTDPAICDPAALRAAHVALARVGLRRDDYRNVVANAARGDFVYLDPPYDPVTTTANFTSYTADAFDRDDQRALADTARDLVARGVYVMASNSDTPLVRKLYRGFQIDRVKVARSINSDAKKRGRVAELIITPRRGGKHMTR
jgi:DNA adenine methylase